MVARRKKRYETGEAANFVSRKQALRKLQLNLKDFRRLCILKGIHPREPQNRKRAQKGDLTKIKTLYHEKDIRFLLHEPIVYKFRDFKVFLKKVKKALNKGNDDEADRLKLNKPKYSLDHIVRERYPTFVDAIRDLEDCLCLCFLYSTFPKNPKTPEEMIALCRRLTVEFMHYVIESKALRKVFVSIKGYYYQAEIMGQTVTWVVPHPTFTYEPPLDVDLRLMSIFVEFYTTMLGFVNFRLYHKLNLKYPPSLMGHTKQGGENGQVDEVTHERVAALNQSLARTVIETEDDKVELDDIPVEDGDERKREMESKKALENLFQGTKIFLNREVPREPLVFMIRASGGQVSWDGNSSDEGATFKEGDVGITHQICDRPRDSIKMSHIGRDYVQPQWVFDSINQRMLLPVHKYFPGEILPPHLSPFIKEERRIGDYIPPEEKKLLGLAKEAEEDENDKNEEESEHEMEPESEEDEGVVGGVDEDDEEEKCGETENMKVEPGKPENPKTKEEEQKQLDDEQYRLRVKMIKKKHKGLYRSMMKARKKRIHESKQLERKRKIHDEMVKKSKGGKTI